MVHQVYRRPLRATAIEIREEKEGARDRRHSILPLEKQQILMPIGHITVGAISFSRYL